MSRSSSQSQGICYSNFTVLSFFPCSFVCQRSDYLYTSLACEALFLTTSVDIFKPFIDVSSYVYSFYSKNADMGMKKVWVSSKVYIDGADADTLHDGEKVTLINWGNFLIKSINRLAFIAILQSDFPLTTINILFRKQNGSIETVDAEPKLDDSVSTLKQLCYKI